MKLLNPNVPKPLPHLFPRAPATVEVFELEGRRIAYDTNDMSVYMLDGDEDPPRGSTGEVQQGPSLHTRPLGLVLCVSDECNLRCDYCYVWDEAHWSNRVRKMDHDTVVRSIELLGCPSRGCPITISFFGGEPMTAWETVKYAVERIDHLATITSAIPQYHITTNGTMINDARATWLAKHGFGVIVSIDGSADHHNKHRKTSKGTGTYREVIAGLRRLKNAGVRSVTLRGTFMPGEVEEVPGRLRALNELCDEGLGHSVSLEPAALAEYGCTGGDDDYAEGEIDQFLELATDVCIERARTNKRVYFAYLQKFLSRLVMRVPSFTECGAGTGYLSVSPDGEIHACHLRAQTIGHVRWGIDEVARRPWIENRSYAHSGCNECWVRRLCGGGCRAFNLKACGDIHTPGRLYCELSRAKARQAMRVLVLGESEPATLRMIQGGAPTCVSACSVKPAE